MICLWAGRRLYGCPHERSVKPVIARFPTQRSAQAAFTPTMNCSTSPQSRSACRDSSPAAASTCELRPFRQCDDPVGAIDILGRPAGDSDNRVTWRAISETDADMR
jgi:hypothetical protein